MGLRFFTPEEHEIVGAAAERMAPADGAFPGARAAGVADYVDGLLGAFATDPPRIWAGGPFGEGIETFLPLGAVEELAWRTRIEGSKGIPEREWNGPVKGLQEEYREGLAALGADFTALTEEEQDARLAAAPPAFRDLLFRHTCEGLYSHPFYGGNRHRFAWEAIGFPGDAQPRGWTDVEVSGRE